MTQRPTPKKLKVREYAERENVSVRTVQRWIEKRAIAVERIGPTRRIRIRIEE